MYDFIDNFPVSEEVKLKLRGIGADSPAALLSTLDAAGTAAEKFLGRQALVRVRRLLRASLSPRERRTFALSRPQFGLGAQLKRPAPSLLPPSFDVRERDRLYSRLQILRTGLRAGHTSSSAQSEIQMLESQLNNMMER